MLKPLYRWLEQMLPPPDRIDPRWIRSPWVWLLNRFSAIVYNLVVRCQFDIQTRGKRYRKNLPDSLLVVSNHQATFDIAFIVVCLPLNRPMAFMAKQELFKNPLARWYLQSAGTFAVNRERLSKETVKSAKLVLSTPGWSMGVFPEGTRSEDGQLGEAKKGVGFLAKAAKSTVLPIAITYTQRKDFFGRQTVILNIGECIPWQAEDTVETFTERYYASLEALLAETQSKEV